MFFYARRDFDRNFNFAGGFRNFRRMKMKGRARARASHDAYVIVEN